MEFKEQNKQRKSEAVGGNLEMKIELLMLVVLWGAFGILMGAGTVGLMPMTKATFEHRWQKDSVLQGLISQSLADTQGVS